MNIKTMCLSSLVFYDVSCVLSADSPVFNIKHLSLFILLLSVTGK